MNQHQHTIQRLVDNELGESEVAKFLQLADQNPELWRQISLAFVEDQAWSSFMNSPLADKVSEKADWQVGQNDGVGTEPTSLPRPAKSNPVSSSQTTWSKFGPQLLMTAAAVLFVLTLALRFNPVESSPGPTPDHPFSGDIAKNDDSSSIASLGHEQAKLASEQVPYRLQTGDVEIPIYEDQQLLQTELQRMTQLTPDIVLQLRNAGYSVSPQISYIGGQLPDGRQIVMPVQQFQIDRFGQ